jgi:hypothetical protein
MIFLVDLVDNWNGHGLKICAIGFASVLPKSFLGSTFIAPNNYFVAARSGAWSGVAGQGRWLTFVGSINMPLTFDNLNYRK